MNAPSHLPPTTEPTKEPPQTPQQARLVGLVGLVGLLKNFPNHLGGFHLVLGWIGMLVWLAVSSQLLPQNIYRGQLYGLLVLWGFLFVAKLVWAAQNAKQPKPKSARAVFRSTFPWFVVLCFWLVSVADALQSFGRPKAISNFLGYWMPLHSFAWLFGGLLSLIIPTDSASPRASEPAPVSDESSFPYGFWIWIGLLPLFIATREDLSGTLQGLTALILAPLWCVLAFRRVRWAIEHLSEPHLESKIEAHQEILTWFGLLVIGVICALSGFPAYEANDKFLNVLSLAVWIACLSWMPLRFAIGALWKMLGLHIDSFLYERQQRLLNPQSYALYDQTRPSTPLRLSIRPWIGLSIFLISVFLSILMMKDYIFRRPSTDRAEVFFFVGPTVCLLMFLLCVSLLASLQSKVVSDVWIARAAMHTYFTKLWGVLALIGILIWFDISGQQQQFLTLSGRLWLIQGCALFIAGVISAQLIEKRRQTWEQSALKTAESALIRAFKDDNIALTPHHSQPLDKTPARFVQSQALFPFLWGLAPANKKAPSKYFLGDPAFDAVVTLKLPDDLSPALEKQFLVMLNQNLRAKTIDAIQHGIELCAGGSLQLTYPVYKHACLTALGEHLRQFVLALRAASPPDGDWDSDATQDRLYQHVQHDPNPDFCRQCAVSLWRNHIRSQQALGATQHLLSHDPPSIALHEATLAQDADAALKTLLTDTPWPDLEGVQWLWAHCLLAQTHDTLAAFFNAARGRLTEPSHVTASLLLPVIARYKPSSVEAWRCAQLSHPSRAEQRDALKALQAVGTLDALHAIHRWLQARPHSDALYALAVDARAAIQSRLGAHVGELALSSEGLSGALSSPLQ